MKEYTFVVSDEYENERVDKFLTANFEDLSRSYIQKQINDGNLLINEKTEKSSYKLKPDDTIKLSIPDSVIPDILPVNIPLDIVYEDIDVAIVNKPQGMVVHPAAGHFDDTMVNALLYHLEGRLSGINGVLRPGIVHRIDKDTSGLLIVCKTDTAHNNIALQLKEHKCNRVYHAIVHGNIDKEEFTIDAPIGRSNDDRKKMCITSTGKPAVTHVKVLERFNGYTYIECKLETGRTHQIRVHLASISHPLVGDPVYNTRKDPIKCSGQLLHAKHIGFLSPSQNRFLEFDSELPDYFEKALNYLKQLT